MSDQAISDSAMPNGNTERSNNAPECRVPFVGRPDLIAGTGYSELLASGFRFYQISSELQEARRLGTADAVSPGEMDWGDSPGPANEGGHMPVISKFYGIVIRMLFSRLLRARFHAIYEESEVVVQIQPLQIVWTGAPERVRQMVLEWAEEHKEELLDAW